jgi:hypothetical protein
MQKLWRLFYDGERLTRLGWALNGFSSGVCLMFLWGWYLGVWL